MSEYIDVEKTDMKQFAFNVVQGIDLPVWKDLQSVEEINIRMISGMIYSIFTDSRRYDQCCV